tara:strand:+ start:229 stop:429 length:201 start_codon:yes stop_codon:yes gene_type:complete
MKSKYISINILEDLLKETKLSKVKNLCRHAIWNIKYIRKDYIENDYEKNNSFYLCYENDPLYKFIK